MSIMTMILADIGGTKMRVARSDDGKTVSEHASIETPLEFDDAIKALCDLARQIAGDEEIEAFAGGVPGQIDKEVGTIIELAHLPQWAGKSLVESIRTHLDIRDVYIRNDVEMVGLGEAATGAGEGYPICAYLTVSTGVGGIRIINNEIDVSSQGFEIGHSIIEAEEFELTDDLPRPGTVEHYISGTSLQARTGEKPWDTVDPARFGDEWEKMERYLAYMLHNISVFWSPDVIVIGGSMMTKKTLFTIDSLQERLAQSLTIFAKQPKILKAAHEDRGGLEGALVYLKSVLE